ncbi:AraC family transcriptional regulator [Planococcus sp. NCCP-2050]|uniref:AraC family transcriptional regulator n=1 Tax=Planococcus sp. NCCP-2050 TaxID=2944679 RepID=UPI00203F41B2|nr:AraC family transcriptional regulator [Planococcus sp. NCCP-2050]GKW45939.1 AraC family transcriptional regulator [Planococcus sp. NCCP-2050]
MKSNEALTQAIEQFIQTDGTKETAIPGLQFIRTSQISEPVYTVYKPSLCIIAQGSKVVTLGREAYHYDPLSYLTASVQLPIAGQVVEATPRNPYLSLQLQLDMKEVLDILQSFDQIKLPKNEIKRGLVISRMNEELLDAALRLVRLLNAPQDIPFLSSGIIREIIYRVMQSEQSNNLKHFALIGSKSQRIAHSIERLNCTFDQPIHVEELAEDAQMSLSSFYSHFKEVTGMSPVQYQKSLRLQEARRLLLDGEMNAAEAAFRVGYESPSHFSREYARKFGLPPGQDLRLLRESLQENTF